MSKTDVSEGEELAFIEQFWYCHWEIRSQGSTASLILLNQLFLRAVYL